MKDSKIDIHKTAYRLETGLLALHRNEIGLTQRNIDFICRFSNDCLLGKTVFKRAKKRISAGRVAKYVSMLRAVAFWLGMDFDKVTQAEMENLVRRIDGNQLSYFDGHRKMVAKTYSAWTRHDFKVTIKKFYKWLNGGEDYPELVRWIDTYVAEEEIPSLSVEEVQKVTSYGRTARDKAIVMMLFETGARAEEFLNIRLRNLEEKGDDLVVRIEVSKTYPRTLILYKCRSFVSDWLDDHPERDNPNAQLFPIKYSTLRLLLGRLGMRAIKKKITPHVLRHSCATRLAHNGVGRYQMCKWMGWSMSSDMPDRYIDRAGVAAEETVNRLRDNELERKERENRELREKVAWMKSEEPLDREGTVLADELLTALMKDQRTLHMLAKELVRHGLAEKLVGGTD